MTKAFTGSKPEMGRGAFNIVKIKLILSIALVTLLSGCKALGAPWTFPCG